MSLKASWLQLQLRFKKLKETNFKQKIWNYVRVRFITGIATLLPLFLTIWTFMVVLKFFDGFLGPWIHRWTYITIPGLGILATITLIFLWGVFTSNIVGKRILIWEEKLIQKIPFAGLIYHGSKQLISALAANQKSKFHRVVLIEYPRRGLYVIAFVTKESSGELQEKIDAETVNVFVPTTPNPTSGFLMLVPKNDVITLDMSVEEAMKVIISGGIVMPDPKEKKKLNEKQEPEKAEIQETAEELVQGMVESS